MISIYNKPLLLKIAALKVFGTFFALFIYGAFVKLGDSAGYAFNNKIFTSNIFLNRTEFVEFVFSSITVVTHSVVITHIISSLFVAYCIYYTFRDLYYLINRYILWIAIMLPHFLVWSGVTTKELLSVALFSVFIRQVFNIIQKDKISKKLLFISGVLGVFIRPHYGIAYLYLLVTTVLIMYTYNGKIKRYSKGVIFTIYGSLFLFVVGALYFTSELWEGILLEVMNTSRNYFVHYSGSSTRYNLEWDSVNDFISFLPNGIFLSLVGPSLSESFSRPLFFIALFEGLIFIGLLFYLYSTLFLRSLKSNFFLLVFLYSFVPSVILLLLAHYPLGVFNPGTALRYKQALIPLMVFFPLLILGLFSTWQKIVVYYSYQNGEPL